MSGPIQHGGGLAAASALYGGRIEDWLDLSTGINPCPPDLPEIPMRAWHRLPDQERETASRHAAQRFYRAGHRLPLPVPGTQSVIQLLPRLVPSGARVAVVSPTYGEYARAFTLAGLAVDAISDLNEISKAHGLVVVVNPNNPDGRLHTPTELRALAGDLADRGGMLVVDEAFGDMLPDQSLAGDDSANLIVFRSFGKFFGLAGIRLGFVIAADEVAAQFSEWLGPWAVSGPALVLAERLMSSDTSLIAQQIRSRALALQEILSEAGFTVSGGTELFQLVEDARVGELYRHLCSRQILTRKFDYRPDWLRFGLAPDEAGDTRLREALRTFRSSSA
ncbi:MAG: threonine-phosphate decarboxylase CobD [Alphaproteobacteria bacterium]|uniref:threonine-phosphate decarboxylase CobD n=1 Tax=Rhizobium sp. R86522 TaxID=3093861 RepID=UPI0036732741|nr:threonine-phosphate decarboxylase CobD [Alphaproteobacteria bacterium]MBU0834794.1 threonine-phosphate decarboxylase CobD [Alphaproteobacteria bacterium]MBU1763625.1 threonine-phosphate decarboxylase CobD [Alphaproteobacteria bacterium]